LLAEGKTQQVVADEMGWSRGKVSQYAMLETISVEPWRLIATSFHNVVADDGDSSVAKIATTVAITENLLRNILNLTEHHQITIIQDLITGEIITGFSNSVITEDGKPVINIITTVITEGVAISPTPICSDSAHLTRQDTFKSPESGDMKTANFAVMVAMAC